MSKNNVSFSTYALIGTMLFGLFFGAGNLIFPIQLGQMAGENFWPALIGFLVTATGLPLLGILAIGLTGSNGLRDLGSRVHPIFGLVFSVALYLTIGPFFAIPRTATVPFTVGFEPFIAPEHLTLFLALFSFIFFAIVYYFSLNPAKIMDYIGKYLTPAFLIFLFVLIIISVIKPMSSFQGAVGDYIDHAFISGFKEGYNTLDALASLAFGIVVINAIKQQGITDKKAIANTTWKAGLFAILLMSIIYGFITYMGAMSVGTIGSFENGALIFAAVADHYFGSFGAILLAIIIVLACLKTSIGLITSCSEFFHEVFPRISYKWYVFILCAVSFTIANFGLNNIITYSVPVLMFLYPLAIVLILLALCAPLFKARRAVFATAMFFTFFISIMDAYTALIPNVKAAQLDFLDSIVAFYAEFLPFYSLGLGWIVPALVGALLGYVYTLFKKA